jgi:hypothetical protein
MVVRVTVGDNRWDPGLNRCFVVVEHRYLLCWTHYPTDLQGGSGTRRMSWPRRVFEVGSFAVSASMQVENLSCQHRINSR